ncbi:T9SS type A sorting domain-containing protein [Bacteroidota bacterium]
MNLKRLFLFIIFLLSIVSLKQVKANDIDTVWMRWTHNVKHIDISPDSRYIVTNDAGNAIVHDLETGDELYTIASIQDAQFTPDNRFIYGHLDKIIVVVDVETRQKRTDIEDSEFGTSAVSANKDGSMLLVSYGLKPGVGIWDIESGEKVDEIIVTNDLEGWEEFYTGNAYFFNNGEQIIFTYSKVKQIAGDYYGEVYIRKVDVNTKAVLLEKKFNDLPFKLSNDETMICIYKYNLGYVDVFSSGSFEKVWQIPNSLGETDIDFSPDDRYLAVAYESKKGIEIWDLEEKQLVYTYLRNPLGSYLSVATSLDENYIAAGTGMRLYLYKSYWSMVTVPEQTIQATITYPNPADNLFNLEFDLLQDNVTSIDLIDLTGAIVKEIDNNFLIAGHQVYSVDITNLPSGFYTLRILSGSRKAVLKIIKL